MRVFVKKMMKGMIKAIHGKPASSIPPGGVGVVFRFVGLVSKDMSHLLSSMPRSVLAG
jgi:hypothetical protein